MNEQESFHHFLAKVRERLTLIFDFHIPNGKPIIDSDRDVLHALYKVYYNGEIEALANEPLHEPEPVQQNMFPTTTAGLFDEEPDKKSEKK